jgi:hypothetical protein
VGNESSDYVPGASGGTQATLKAQFERPTTRLLYDIRSLFKWGYCFQSSSFTSQLLTVRHESEHEIPLALKVAAALQFGSEL